MLQYISINITPISRSGAAFCRPCCPSRAVSPTTGMDRQRVKNLAGMNLPKTWVGQMRWFSDVVCPPVN